MKIPESGSFVGYRMEQTLTYWNIRLATRGMRPTCSFKMPIMLPVPMVNVLPEPYKYTYQQLDPALHLRIHDSQFDHTPAWMHCSHGKPCLQRVCRSCRKLPPAGDKNHVRKKTLPCSAVKSLLGRMWSTSRTLSTWPELVGNT